MDEAFRANLEANGYHVFTRVAHHRRLGTQTFIRKPDGTLSEFFDELWQIPMDLPVGYEVSTYDIEVPIAARNDQSHELHAQQLTYGQNGELDIGILLVLIFIGAKMMSL